MSDAVTEDARFCTERATQRAKISATSEKCVDQSIVHGKTVVKKLKITAKTIVETLRGHMSL